VCSDGVVSGWSADVLTKARGPSRFAFEELGNNLGTIAPNTRKDEGALSAKPPPWPQHFFPPPRVGADPFGGHTCWAQFESTL
jgi:hypothetical protein